MLNDVKPKRLFPTLDGIRGIAAILVVMRHVPCLAGINFQESYLAVDLFFILSGAVIANAYETRLSNGLSPSEFIWLRIVRIYPMYILGSTISLVFWSVNKNAPGNIYLIIPLALILFPNFTSRVPFLMNGPAWSLFSEIVANIALSMGYKKMTNKVLIGVIFLSACGLAVILSVNGEIDVGYNTKSTPLGIVRVCFSFFAGILIFRIYSFDRYSFKSNTFLEFIPWLILFAVFLLLSSSPSHAIQPFFDFITVTILFPCILYTSFYFNPTRFSLHIFKFLGIISYPIYAVHAPLVKWLPTIFGAGMISPLSQRPIEIGVGFIIFLLPLCWVLDRYVDEPVRKLLLKAGKRIQRIWQRKNMISAT